MAHQTAGCSRLPVDEKFGQTANYGLLENDTPNPPFVADSQLGFDGSEIVRLY